MIILGAVCAANIAPGYSFSGIPLALLAYIDAGLKFIFGIGFTYYSFRDHQKAKNSYIVDCMK